MFFILYFQDEEKKNNIKSVRDYKDALQISRKAYNIPKIPDLRTEYIPSVGTPVVFPPI